MPKPELDTSLFPRLVLRVAFAGSQSLDGDSECHLARSLDTVFNILGHHLACIHPEVPVGSVSSPQVARFYHPGKLPLLRVVTGLCQGADTVAAATLDKVRILAENGLTSQVCLETELAAVLPFPVPAYRKSRPPEFHDQFDRSLSRCSYVLTLDGKYERGSKIADHRRRKAYRTQGAVLLRHGDILVAAANPDVAGKAGGALETVREALQFELPVVFINHSNGNIHLVEPGEDFLSVMAGHPLEGTQLNARLGQWVARIVADPDGLAGGANHCQDVIGQRGVEFLEEFFSAKLASHAAPENRKPGVRERIWTAAIKRLSSGKQPRPDKILAPYDRWRMRATSLNYHYAGQYRGAFLLNYMLVILAVAIATASLVVLGQASHSGPAEHIGALAESTARQNQASQAGSGQVDLTLGHRSHPPSWLYQVLIAMGMFKLAIVIFIARNTHKANHGQWNDRAVDYRYLAERLRALYYLPQAGSFQPPAAAPPQYASRVVRQSAVDWLVDAIIRGVSPAECLGLGGNVARERGVAILALDPLAAATRIRDYWVHEQAVYHGNNAETMGKLYQFCENIGSFLGRAVIVFVILDILLVMSKIHISMPPKLMVALKFATPWLIFLAAVLPAAVAALNGIRFQSECRRLAERSMVMRSLLIGKPDSGSARGNGGRWIEADSVVQRIQRCQEHTDENLGSWSLDVLMLAEKVAHDFAQEVAEWSVLYAKELPEPG